MSGAAAFIGPLTDLLFNVGSSYESGRRSNVQSKLTDAAMTVQKPLSAEMQGWGQQDWERFKTTVAPMEEAVTARAARGIDPQLERATGAVAVESRIRSPGTGTNLNPASGAGVSAMTRAGTNQALQAGIGVNRARTGERNRVDDFNWRNRYGVTAAGRGIPASSAEMFSRGQDFLNQSARRSAGLGDAYSTAQMAGFEGAGEAAGELFGYGVKQFGGSNTRSALDYGDSDAGNVNYGGEYWYADGGLVEGPGTGRSDSVPAVIDGEVPARVSNREYVIPHAVVMKVGRDFLDGLRAKYHRA